MARFIRWAVDVIRLCDFPEQTRTALSRLTPGSYTVIAVSVDTHLYVKRLSPTAFQLGLETDPEFRAISSSALAPSNIYRPLPNQVMADESVHC